MRSPHTTTRELPALCNCRKGPLAAIKSQHSQNKSYIYICLRKKGLLFKKTKGQLAPFSLLGSGGPEHKPRSPTSECVPNSHFYLPVNSYFIIRKTKCCFKTLLSYIYSVSFLELKLRNWH